MDKVQGPLWGLVIAAALWLLMEAAVHFREFKKDRAFKRSRRERGRMPKGWDGRTGDRFVAAVARPRRR